MLWASAAATRQDEGPVSRVGFRAERALIETATTCDSYSTEGVITLHTAGGPDGQEQTFSVQILREEWSQAR